MNTEKIVKMTADYVMNTYTRNTLAPVRGEGAVVFDAEGKAYLDFVAGIAVNNVGHCHPKVVTAIKEQAEKLIHCSNLYCIDLQAELAKMLVENSCFDKVFFCNSGAEANEAAIKLARRFARVVKGEDRFEIVSMKKSFHGRTLATITATGQTKYQKGFEPLPSGFVYVDLNDFEGLKSVVSSRTCAVMVELIQGEGGVNPACKEYIAKVRELCTKEGILLIIDEVQTGMGRTGKLFAYEHYDIKPDIISLAKGLGGGVPIGAILVTDEVAKGFEPGMHASTFGGNPLSCAAGIAVMKILLEDGLLSYGVRMGQYLAKKLDEFKSKFSFVTDVRGMGLMCGVQLDKVDNNCFLVKRCQELGLIINCIHGDVIRLVPPLVITEEQVDEGIGILEKVFEEYANL
jgi:acetylornithine/N-succinyldiaminopimelate aminotransferase